MAGDSGDGDIRQWFRPRFLVHFHRCPVRMGGGFLQRGGIGQDGVGRIIQARSPGLVPQPQNTAHGRVYGVVCQFVIILAILEQTDDLPVHLYRANPGVVVDGFQVVQARVVVLNVEQLMIP